MGQNRDEEQNDKQETQQCIEETHKDVHTQNDENTDANVSVKANGPVMQVSPETQIHSETQNCTANHQAARLPPKQQTIKFAYHRKKKGSELIE